MKYLFLSLIIVVAFSVIAQKMPEYGLNKIRITQPSRTLLVEIFPTKEPPIHNDRTYYWYSNNNVHITQGGFSGKLLNGNYQEFDARKELREQGRFKKGLKDGTWKSWNEKGLLTGSTTWKDGLKQGEFELYDEQGNLKQTGNHHNGLLNGKLILHYGPDSVRMVHFKSGKEVISNKTNLWQKVWKKRAKKANTPAN